MNNNIKIHYPDCLRELSNIFLLNNECLYIVGGYIRDSLMGYECYDIDICSKASPDKVKKMLYDSSSFKVLDSSLPLGTLLIKHNNITLEYTSFRNESYVRDGSHTPKQVSFNATIKEDGLRRDFTANAIYFNIENDLIIDMFDGVSDIKNKRLCTTRNADDVFIEDALRILRMCRICAQTMFYPTNKTLKAAKKLSNQISNLSKERIVQEIYKILTADSRYPNNDERNIFHGIELLFESGVAERLIPNAKITNAKKSSLANSMAVKIALLVIDTTDIKNSLDYLCINNNVRAEVLFLFDNVNHNDDMSLSFIVNNGFKKGCMLKEFLKLLDVNCVNLCTYLDNMKKGNKILSIESLAISGQDIMKVLNINASPRVGEIKKELFCYVIEFPKKNTKEHLLNFIKKL